MLISLCQAHLIHILPAGMSKHHLNDTAPRIVVAPLRSSYFVGKALSVTVTITNTHSPQVQVVLPRSTHKCCVHSHLPSALACTHHHHSQSPQKPLECCHTPPEPKSSATPIHRGLMVYCHIWRIMGCTAMRPEGVL